MLLINNVKYLIWQEIAMNGLLCLTRTPTLLASMEEAITTAAFTTRVVGTTFPQLFAAGASVLGHFVICKPECL